MCWETGCTLFELTQSSLLSLPQGLEAALDDKSAQLAEARRQQSLSESGAAQRVAALERHVQVCDGNSVHNIMEPADCALVPAKGCIPDYNQCHAALLSW